MIICAIIPSAIIFITLIARWSYLNQPRAFAYAFQAKTKDVRLDHSYRFYMKKVNRQYRCYIERTPSFRNRDTSRYIPHYYIENGTGRIFICWTGKIHFRSQARTLCRNWANATQQFIDTGIPAPGFGRR